jgi:ABC-type nitrate/sulfonate/bicarbonate transport system substrate-binding protein
VRNFLQCKSPFLRATLGMAAQAANLTEADPRSAMVAIYQHSWSAGGDVMVVRSGAQQPKDLKGKNIVVQRFGPHVDYLLKILADAGLSPSDVKIRYVHDLPGKGSNTPMAAFQSDSTVDAAMVIDPDAATLTSGGAGSSAGSVGTGA